MQKSPWSLVMDGWTDKTYLCAPPPYEGGLAAPTFPPKLSKLQFSEVGKRILTPERNGGGRDGSKPPSWHLRLSTAIYAYLQIDVTRDRKCPAGSWNWKWFFLPTIKQDGRIK